jgi:hypothetical protein
MKSLARALVIAAILMLLPLSFHVNTTALNNQIIADGSGPTPPPPPPPGSNFAAPAIQLQGPALIADGSGPTPPPPPPPGNLFSSPVQFLIADGSGPTPPPPPPPGSNFLTVTLSAQVV